MICGVDHSGSITPSLDQMIIYNSYTYMNSLLSSQSHNSPNTLWDSLLSYNSKWLDVTRVLKVTAGGEGERGKGGREGVREGGRENIKAVDTEVDIQYTKCTSIKISSYACTIPHLLSIQTSENHLNV